MKSPVTSLARLSSIFLLIVSSVSVVTAQTIETDSSEFDVGEFDSIPDKEKKSFHEIITNEAHSMEGMFTVHEVKNKYYFELPDSIFGRDIMSITRISKTPTGAGYGGELGNRQVIRFEKGPREKIFIRVVNFINVSTDTTQPIHSAVTNSNLDPIAASFNIAATRGDTSTLIDVTSFFERTNQAFIVNPFFKQRFKLKKLERDRSYIQDIRAYPINVEVKTVKTYTVTPPSISPPESGRRPRTVDLTAGISAGVLTFELNTSMILLPKVPRKRRLFDQRVGIFANSYTVFSDDQQRSERQVFTVRWPLDPKSAEEAKRQQAGELIEPKKPIVFYIDPATPVRWREALKQGVEDWKPAFEHAGWKNAIQAKNWPENDTTMSLEDARFSVIRYFASSIQNAYGPNIHDPRSGEIIESHVGWYHNVMRLLKNWYTTQTAASDERARANIFDDQLMSQLIRFVAAHEVGHTLGLRHNFGASHATPVEKLRDKAWLEENGHTSSIMDYARFNYVAQPEDGIEVFMPGVGAYDKWAIEWNYKPIYGTNDIEDDRKILNAWYLEKAANNPALHFLTERSLYDPRAQSEDLGDNSMLSSEYGIANLKRILPNAINWTKEEGKDFQRAEELYDNIFGQFRRYIGHVSKWVGGIFDTPKSTDQDGSIFEPAPKSMQKSAVAFLQKQLFQEPSWLVNQEVLNKLKAENGLKRIGDLQQSTINNLYQTSRLQRLVDAHAAYPQAYGLEEFFGDMQKGIWSEIMSGGNTNVYRRNLQKIHLEKLIKLLEPSSSSNGTISTFVRSTASVNTATSDIRSLSMGTLMELEKQIKKSIKGNINRMTKFHYVDCQNRINKALSTDG